MRVNIEELKKAKAVNGMFCQYCGETDPKNGFYPMTCGCSDSVSSLLCNDCDKKLREKANK